jgi:uncharacterized protein YcfL
MRKQIVILSILAVVLIAGTASVNAATSALSVQTTAALECDTLVPSNQIPNELERLHKELPNTLDEARQRIQVRYRFLLYTHDGLHIMWGQCGNGIFIGTDNLGKRVWGIYGNQVSAGLYDGQFFWGKYRNGYWAAIDLFNTPRTHGQYHLFPINPPTLTCEVILLD